jgi:uncharacterized protein YciI
MPLFVMLGTDGPRGAELRPLHRPAHLENLAPLARDGRVAYAGPLLGPGGQPCGSLVVFEAENLVAARAFAETDPYVSEGVFERIQLWETRQVLPKDG